MYILRYLDKDQSFTSEIDLMDKIKSLQGSDDFNKQFVVVEKEGNGCMEIALGMGKESLLFYTPESEDEDCKISCNETIARAKSEELHITSHEDEKLIFSKSNTVPLEEAYEVIEAYLKGDDFMKIVDWYTY